MSYDLYLSSPRVNREAFDAFFKNRPHYESAGWYANNDTGVYFSFQYSAEGDQNDPESPEAMRNLHVAFNLNYFRPHVFGLEAEPEVSAFVAAFDCKIFDPQNEGMGEGPYSPDGFLRGWNAGNLFGYHAITQQGGSENTLSVDDAWIERVWRWNLDSRSIQEKFGEGRFIPRISWGKSSRGEAVSFAIWGEGVGIALPACATHALLAREKRGGLFGGKKAGLEVKLLDIRDVSAIAGCAWDSSGQMLMAPATQQPSRAVLDAFAKGFGDIDSVVKRYGSDMVLDKSLMDQARR